VDVSIVASVLEVRAASIFRTDPEQPKNKINTININHHESLKSVIIEICCDKSKCNAQNRACRINGGEEECMYDIGEKAKRKEATRKTKT
jgi:hypothetical protein